MLENGVLLAKAGILKSVQLFNEHWRVPALTLQNSVLWSPEASAGQKYNIF
jgi:hypothetical protein